MKQRKNRIASQGLNGGWEWYWLQNRVQNSAAYFAGAGNRGICYYNTASNEAGVRPVAGLLDFTTTQRARPGAAL